MTSLPLSLPDQILTALRQMGSRPALSSGERNWSGADLAALCDSATARLDSHPGDSLPWPPPAADDPTLLPTRLAALRLGLTPDEISSVTNEGGRRSVCSLDGSGRQQNDEATAIRYLSDHFPPGSRLTVLAPLGGLGSDAALACWRSGGHVLHQPGADSSPGRALRQLEQNPTEVAALSAPLLRALSHHPALALADFGPLRHILHDAGTLSATETAPWRNRDITLIGPPLATSTTDWLAEAEAAVETDMAEFDFAAAVTTVERLGYTALLSMLNALQRRGLFTQPEARHDTAEILLRAEVAEEHQPLIRRWLRVLEEHGLLHRNGARWRAVPAVADYTDDALARAWDGLERDWRIDTGGSGTIAYARSNTECLPDLMAGQVRAVHLLFPEGRTDLACALYREPVAARYQHRTVAAVVSRIAADWSGPGPLRLLEVGAGTGATSETLLPALAATGSALEYWFTDVSRYFLDQAAGWLAAYPFVRRCRYDIDLPPITQGQAAGSFDVVIAGGALNAARDTDASVGWLRELLRPDGWLVLTEPTIEEVWVMASQAFMLAEAHDGRRHTDATFLSLPQWHAVLDRAGLRRVATLPRPDHPLARLGHLVFLAQAGQEEPT
ncbi:class I SAM-dependent methyltransferase [Magnetospirillum molischianum]|nr:class I SAM-dependent methyltransferase [Magnetospirillum molischianum]